MSTTFAVPPRPALLIRTSMRPRSEIAAAISSRTSPSSVTLHSRAGGRVPVSFPSSPAASSRRRSWMSLIITAAPSSAQRRAAAKPMPVPAAAVTSTVLPARSWWPST
jgi:hypothetical protein